MTKPARGRRDRDAVLVAEIAACVSFLAFLYYFRHGYVLLYGDAVAHLNIARRVFDSRTPGPLQLGTVWLPLPHVMMIPFLLSDAMWRTGMGGSLPSMAAFVMSALGIFRLVRGALSFGSVSHAGARLAAWLAAGIYVANPNLIYLQATAMTESLSLAFFLWAIVFFNEFVQQRLSKDADAERASSRSLVKCGWCLLAACGTRYDGWFLAVALAGAAVLFLWRQRRRAGLLPFLLLAAAGPVFWLAYNGIIYRNPLEFANGPYSAKAIEQRTAAVGNPPHPGAGNLAVAATYFVKAAEMNVAGGNWGRVWLLLAIAGAAMIAIFDRRLWPLLLLGVLLPFYILSVAYGGIPIFLPVWWPYSFYNTRYGLELLPALAVGVALATYFLALLVRNRMGRILIASCVVAFVAGSDASIWREKPIVFREAWINSRTRLALEHELASTLQKLPPDSTVLMYLGDHVGALQDAGIPLRRVINEGNHRTWKQPFDAEGLWERSLADPARYVDYVVAVEGDPVAKAVKQHHLTPMAEIHASGQPWTTVYKTH